MSNQKSCLTSKIVNNFQDGLKYQLNLLPLREKKRDNCDKVRRFMQPVR